MEKRAYLSDSFESQKEVSKAISRGLMNKEVTVNPFHKISSMEMEKAKERSAMFCRKYKI